MHFQPAATLRSRASLLCLLLGAMLAHVQGQNLDTPLARGYELLEQNSWKPANRLLDSVRQVAHASGNWDAYFESCYMLAFVANRTADHRLITALAPELQRSLQHPSPMVPYLYLALANAADANNAPDQAIDYFQQAADEVAKKYPEEVAAHLTALAGTAIIRKQSGDFEAARISNEEAVLLADQAAGSDPEYFLAEKIRILNNLAVMEQDLGHFPVAESHYRAALQVGHARNYPAAQLGPLHINLAFCYLKQNALDAATRELQIALKLKGLSDTEKGRAWRFLADIYLNQHHLAAAKNALAAAQTCFSDLPPMHSYRARLLTLHAQILKAEGQWAQGLACYQQVWPHLVAGFDPNGSSRIPAPDAWETDDLLLEVLQEEAAFLLDWYHADANPAHLHEAWSLNQLAIRLSDSLRVRLASDASQLALAGLYPGLFQQGITLALTLSRHENTPHWQWQAFQLAAHQKSMVLREQLRRSNNRWATWPDSLSRRYQVQQARLGDLQRSIREAPSETQRISLQQQYFAGQAAFNRWQKTLVARFPASFEPYATPDFRADSLSRKLPPRSRLIEFYWGPDSAWAFIVRQGKLQVQSLPPTDSLALPLNRYLAYLRNPNAKFDQQVAASGRYLTAVLAKDALSDENDTWLVVPDGPLNYLPWGALPVGDGWLVQHRVVHYAASTYLILSQEKRKGKVRSNYLGMAPDYAQARGMQAKPSEWPPLFFTKEEIQQTAALFSGKTRIGGEASKQQFLKDAPQFRYLHLALHAFAGDSAHESGGLVFARGEKVYDYELLGLPLSADLVVLSACETGFGPFREGEGVMSLGRSFRAAGCGSVLMSHWSVNDEATAWLITHFFQRMKEGNAPEKALQLAQADYLSQSDRVHPYYWAGFVLSGESFSQPLTDSDFPLGWIAGLGTLLLLLVLTGFLLRRKFSAFQ